MADDTWEDVTGIDTRGSVVIDELLRRKELTAFRAALAPAPSVVADTGA